MRAIKAATISLDASCASLYKRTDPSVHVAHFARPNCAIVRIEEPSNIRDYALSGNCHVPPQESTHIYT